jgi:carnosine N-methyltransferase
MLKQSTTNISGISVHIDDPDAFLAETYSLYSQILLNHTKQLNRLRSTATAATSMVRQGSLLRIAQAMESNLSSIKDILHALEPHVKVTELAKVHLNPTDNLTGYLKDYAYLRRDWSGSLRSERQLNTIRDTLERIVLSHLVDTQSSLFLGAGVGRIAFELTDHFERVYATDKSFSMAWHYHKLKTNTISFYEINHKNIATVDEQVHLINASPLHVAEKNVVQRRLDKLEYFISDALSLPFEDQTLSSVFSIYFSDVIALKLWLPEIKRVLKKDGVFVHFGPLDYFFEDVTEMLTCEEVRAVFEDNDFVILADEFTETEHLPSDSLMANKLYNNWIFAAQYEPKTPMIQDVDFETVLTINNKVKYRVSGMLSNEGDTTSTVLEMPNGEVYVGADSVVDILRFIDGIRSIDIVANCISQHYGTEALTSEEKNALLGVCKTLLGKGVLSYSN